MYRTTTQPLLAKHRVVEDGFVRIVKAARLEANVKRGDFVAVRDIMLGAALAPAKLDLKPIDPFGRNIAVPSLLEVLFAFMPNANCEDRHGMLKDVNMLLLRGEHNFGAFLSNDCWQLWVLPLLCTVPADQDLRENDPVLGETYKYIMNIFVMLHLHAFSKPTFDIEKLLRTSLEHLTAFAGWTSSSALVARSMLASLVCKIKHPQQLRLWKQVRGVAGSAVQEGKIRARKPPVLALRRIRYVKSGNRCFACRR